MGFKFKVDEVTAKRLARKIEDLPEDVMGKKEARSIASMVIKDMKAFISKGISPIRGKGRFAAYRGSYLKQIQETGRVKGFNKRDRPVNLKLSGDFLKSLSSKTRKAKFGVAAEVFIKGKKNQDKERGHREGANRQAKRPIIPDISEGEEIAQSIQVKYLKILNRSLKKAIKKKA